MNPDRKFPIPGILALAFSQCLEVFAGEAMVPRSAIAEGLQWCGVAVAESNFSMWCVSPIVGDDGKTHLFCARWPETNVDPAWRKSSELAHYVGDRPEGPYAFRGIAMRGSQRTGEWDAFGPHNPEVRKIGDTYVLVYIANSDFHQPPHPLNQRIGMATATSLDGPWKKVGDGGPVLSPSPDKNHWTHGSQVVNPSLIKVGDKFHLYFKARYMGGTAYGLATADRLEGPYTFEPMPLTYDGIFIEDGSAFAWNGKICLLTTDNHGKVTGIRGGGALWVSDDGKTFDPKLVQLGYDLIPHYFKDYDATKVRKVYGPDPKIERPKILMMDGKPAYLFGTSGWTVHGGPRTADYVLKINLPDRSLGVPPR